MNAELKHLIETSEHIVFFGGAGVSTESGIPDFRSLDGLYSQRYRYPPETMLSRTFFDAHTAEFYDFYRNKMLFLQAKPNKAHLMLAALEKQGRLKTVITQNIDGLHQQAGSKNVLELHGSVHQNYCMSCGKQYTVSAILEAEGIPHCTCSGIIKPDVVLYEEGLNNETLQRAAEAIREADMLIIGGTSLAVYPAAGLVKYYNGNRLVLINKTATPLDARANLILRGAIGEELGE